MSARAPADGAQDGSGSGNGFGYGEGVSTTGARAGDVIHVEPTGVDHCAAGVSAVGGKGERAGVELRERSASAHGAGVGAVGELIEDDGGIVVDAALQAGGVALERTGGDG